MWAKGEGGPRNLTRAVELYEEAVAAAGEDPALAPVAVRALNGLG
jgi:TPR repeat protein